jgi:hypothetical protein
MHCLLLTRFAAVRVLSASCEHNDRSPVDLLAAKAGPGPGVEMETGLDNKSAVAFEKHRIRLRIAAGAWRDALARACPSPNLLHRRRSCPPQEDLRRADERQERAARSLVQSLTSGVGTATMPPPPPRHAQGGLLSALRQGGGGAWLTCGLEPRGTLLPRASVGPR